MLFESDVVTNAEASSARGSPILPATRATSATGSTRSHGLVSATSGPSSCNTCVANARAWSWSDRFPRTAARSTEQDRRRETRGRGQRRQVRPSITAQTRRRTELWAALSCTHASQRNGRRSGASRKSSHRHHRTHDPERSHRGARKRCRFDGFAFRKARIVFGSHTLDYGALLNREGVVARRHDPSRARDFATRRARAPAPRSLRQNAQGPRLRRRRVSTAIG